MCQQIKATRSKSWTNCFTGIRKRMFKASNFNLLVKWEMKAPRTPPCCIVTDWCLGLSYLIRPLSRVTMSHKHKELHHKRAAGAPLWIVLILLLRDDSNAWSVLHYGKRLVLLARSRHFCFPLSGECIVGRARAPHGLTFPHKIWKSVSGRMFTSLTHTVT